MEFRRWAPVGEIIASVAVVVTLIVLIVEIRGNTLAIERQAVLDRSEHFSAPYLDGQDLAAIHAKVKAKDGVSSVVQAIGDRYALSPQEAVVWHRYLDRIWSNLIANYRYGGPSAEIEETVAVFLTYPDSQIYWEHNRGIPVDFRTYVQSFIDPEKPAN